MMKSIYSLIFLFIFISCATKEEKKFSDQVAPDLTKVFNLSDKRFEKFKVEEIKPLKNKKTKIKKVNNEKKIKQEKKITKKTTKTNKVDHKKIAVIKSKKQTVVPTEKKVEQTPVTPKNYPKVFFNYDKKSKKVWEKFHPRFTPGEKFVISLSYLGVTAGHIHIETKHMVQLNNQETYHFVARLKSAAFYKYIYSLDDTVESFISKDAFLPLKYTLAQRESGQIVDDLQLFDHEKHQTFFWYKRLKKGKTKTRHVEAFIPRYFQDSFSSLFFVRGLPLKNGDIYEFPVLTRGKIWLIKMKISKRENIEIMDKEVRAIKVVAETHFPGVLKKKGDIIFWYSDDASRRLLKFQANVKIGAVKGELIDYSKPAE